MRATCPAKFIVLHLIALTVLGEKFKLSLQLYKVVFYKLCKSDRI